MMPSNRNVHLYEGCGNRLLIAHLQNNFSYSASTLRQQLKELGLKYNADSVLVLTGNPRSLQSQGYHVTMDVFEPRGHDPQNSNLVGSWSTMCGNGVRAVVRYLLDQNLVDRDTLTCLIKTRSGIRSVEILPNNQFRVCMGSFSMQEADLKKYIRNFSFQDLIPENLNFSIDKIVAGLNGNFDENGSINGEPHLLIFINKGLGELSRLIDLTNNLGSLITTSRYFFPDGINTNLVLLERESRDTLEVTACTFERGVEYVTQSCGTGATAIGSYLLSVNSHLSTIIIRMPGGMLKVEHVLGNQYFLTGSANPLPLEEKS